MTKLLEKDRTLYKRIDEVLHYLWDPIGVSGEPAARDEYDSYLPQVFSLLKNGSSTDAVARHLTEIIVGRMGMNANVQHDMKIANILSSWAKKIESE